MQAPKNVRDAHETKSLVIALSGFILSVFFIIWALIILVRFYIFDNIFYNIFLACMFLTGNEFELIYSLSLKFLSIFAGIGFNIASINLMLTDVTEFSFILPFVVGTPVSIFWTILCIFLPIFKKNFYSQFAFMPIALYDGSFYDGLGHDPNKTSVHPFAKPFMPDNSFFDKTTLILLILVISASKQTSDGEEHFISSFLIFSVAQLIFWMFSISFYYKLKQEAKQMKKEDEAGSKTL